MKVVYVAGRFRGRTPWDIQQNVRRAEEAGLAVAKCGAMPLIPHKNTEHFHGSLDDEFWLEGTKELLRRADALYVFDIKDLSHSEGTRGEVSEAKKREMPIFVDVAGLKLWLDGDDRWKKKRLPEVFDKL